MALASRPMPESPDSVQLRRTDGDPQCPLYVDSSRPLGAHGGHSLADGERVKSTQRNCPRCEPKNQRAPTEFHVDSADVRSPRVQRTRLPHR